jgi:hypothetical protein
MSEVVSFFLDIVAFAVSIIALLLYVRDKLKVKPVIQQVFVRRSNDNPPNHMIQASIVNIGENEARDCNVELLVNGNKVDSLVFPTVDSPIGRVGRDWAIQDRITLYPKTPIWVRGYTSAGLDDEIEVVLKQGNKVRDRKKFKLRFTTDSI